MRSVEAATRFAYRIARCRFIETASPSEPCIVVRTSAKALRPTHDHWRIFVATYAIGRLDEIDELPDGRYRYRPVRHHFGIKSFGVTAWVGAAAGDPIINEYDEDSEPSEELFVVVSGRAVFNSGARRSRRLPAP